MEDSASCSSDRTSTRGGEGIRTPDPCRAKAARGRACTRRRAWKWCLSSNMRPRKWPLSEWSRDPFQDPESSSSSSSSSCTPRYSSFARQYSHSSARRGRQRSRSANLPPNPDEDSEQHHAHENNEPDEPNVVPHIIPTSHRRVWVRRVYVPRHSVKFVVLRDDDVESGSRTLALEPNAVPRGEMPDYRDVPLHQVAGAQVARVRRVFVDEPRPPVTHRTAGYRTGA